MIYIYILQLTYCPIGLRMSPIWPMLLPSWMLVGRSHRWLGSSQGGSRPPWEDRRDRLRRAGQELLLQLARKAKPSGTYQLGWSCMLLQSFELHFPRSTQKEAHLFGMKTTRKNEDMPENMHPKDLGYPLDRWFFFAGWDIDKVQ